MPRKTTIFSFLFILSFTIQSCSPAKTPQQAVSGQPTALSTQQPASGGGIADEMPAVLKPTTAEPAPPPLDLFDQFKLEANDDPAHDGTLLVKLLQYAAGEITAEQASIPGGLRASDLTPLVTTARQWLESPDAVSSDKDEIKRLLHRLVPEAEILTPYAQAESRGTRPAGLSKMLPRSAYRPSLDTTELCSSLWITGFPAPGLGTPPPVCVLYREFTVSGVDFRVFYPVEWQATGENLEYINAAEEALRRSVEAFMPLAHAGIPDTDLVFTLQPHTSTDGEIRPLVYAAALPFTDDQCGVGVFPHGLTLDVPGFQQTLAHEIFHCFQDRNFDHPFSGDPEVNNWFVEGSAEYFGNYAYPTVNAEYEFIGDISSNIALYTLFDLDYENFLFFQFLANRIGNEELIQVLTSLPSEGDANIYAASLQAGLPDFSGLFQEFAQDYYDRLIADSGGGMVPVMPMPEYTDVIELGSTTYSIDPFVVPHWRLVFPEGRTYTLHQRATGLGKEGFETSAASREWGPIPENISTLCGERVLVLTSTSIEAGGSYEVVVEADYEETPVEDGAGCDRCLAGTWEMTPETVDSFMSSVMPDGIAYHGHSGRILTTFTPDGHVMGAWEDFKVNAAIDAGGTPLDVEMSYVGFSNGDWYTRDGTIYYLNSVSNLILTTTAAGITSAPMPMGDSPGSSSVGDGPYTCEGNIATFTPPVEPVFTRVFQRISP